MATQRKRTERLRGRAGQAQRLRRLQAEPLCRDCKERGIITPSTVPDHIKPLSQGGSDDDSNIRCLCGPCHAIRTAEQFGHQHQAGLGACDANGMPTDPAHPWNRPPGGVGGVKSGAGGVLDTDPAPKLFANTVFALGPGGRR